MSTTKHMTTLSTSKLTDPSIAEALEFYNLGERGTRETCFESTKPFARDPKDFTEHENSCPCPDCEVWRNEIDENAETGQQVREADEY